MARGTVYNTITTQEKFEAINPKNIILGEDWLAYLQSIDRSPKSIMVYKSDLNIFWVWNLDHNRNKYFIEISKKELVRFQSHAINVWQWSPSRIRRVKSCLSSLSTYIEDILDEEEEFKNFKPIVKKIENPKKEVIREKTVLPDEEVDRLLDILVDKKKYEQACAIAICAHSGMRKSELLQMKVKFFDDSHLTSSDSMWKTDTIRTKGSGKLGKPLKKFVLYGAKPYIDLWLNQRIKLGIESEFLFVAKTRDKNGNLVWGCRKDIDHWTKLFSTILNDDFYFHCLRHYTCTKLHRMNLPSHVIQEFFGWSSSEMLTIYNDITAEDEFDKYFDKNGIKEVQKGSL